MSTRDQFLSNASAIVAELRARCSLWAPTPDEVYLIFLERQKRGTPELGDIFLILDRQPTRFGNLMHMQDWHAALRRCRNDLEYGPKLFALWSEAEV